MAKFVLLTALLMSPLGLCAPAPGYPFTATQRNDTGVRIPEELYPRSDVSMPPKYGEKCIGWTEGNENNQVRGVFQCTEIPVGLAIMGGVWPAGIGAETQWFDQPGTYTTEWRSVIDSGNIKGPDALLRYDLRTNTPAFSCEAYLHEVEKEWYQRNQFQAIVTCTKLPEFAKVRAKLGLIAEIDKYSDWMNGPISEDQTVSTDLHTPTNLVKDPNAEMQFNFSH